MRGGGIHDIHGDARDYKSLKAALADAAPDVVIHMAAQPIVRKSYADPRYTFETNVMGTVNILESARQLGAKRLSVLNVTSDKVYRNNEWHWGYRETDELCGFDPYSNSKSCSELVAESYRNSFFGGSGVALSTARAGNVIGGGDFAADRIIPDCVRAAAKREAIAVRNPHSIRPYQHVLEPLAAYLAIAEKQFAEPEKYASVYNVGPDDSDCVATAELVDMFCREWGQGLSWKSASSGGPHEAAFLKLDCSKAKAVLGWSPKWHIQEAVAKTCEWAKAWLAGGDVARVMRAQIGEYFGWE